MLLLSLGLSSQQGAILDAHHSARGDIAASDGGWLAAECGSITDPCAQDVGDRADGHHHHGSDTMAAAQAPVAALLSAPIRIAALRTARPVVQPLIDAEPVRLGHVPRALAYV